LKIAYKAFTVILEPNKELINKVERRKPGARKSSLGKRQMP